MPGGAHAKHIGKEGDRARRRDAAHLAHMHPNKVDERVGNERLPFARVVEQLAHGDRRGALFANTGEPFQVFGRQRVFQKEEIKRLDPFGKLHRFNRVQPLVNIMQQFDLLTHLRPHILDHTQGVAHIGFAVKIAPLRRIVGLDNRIALTAIAAQLNADVAIALGHQALDIVGDLLRRLAVSVGIDMSRFARLAAEQLVDRHVGLLALNVPQRLINPRHGIVQNRPIAPVAVEHGHLPDLLNAGNIMTEQIGFQVLFQRRHHGMKLGGKTGAAYPIQPRLRGQHFDDDHAGIAVGLGGDHVDVANGDRFGHGKLLSWLIVLKRYCGKAE